MTKTILKYYIFIYLQTKYGILSQKHLNKLETELPETEITDYMSAKGYLPKESILPQILIKDTTHNDASYVLSKLTDEELIKLLNDEPKKKIYDLDDVVRIALDGKSIVNDKIPIPRKERKEDHNELRNNVKKNTKPPAISDKQIAFHKLGNKEIIPQHQNKASFLAMKKLHNLLYNRSPLNLDDDNLNDEKKELLFDVFVEQLKTICCKSNLKETPHINIATDIILGKKPSNPSSSSRDIFKRPNQSKEFIFLILNEEIESKHDDELVIVNPDTLEKNSSVLILGPVTSPLTDAQLRIVMNRISNELSKPEYATLLQQLSNGTLSKKNLSVMNNFIYGPETRRYIKAHRCNHQSKLAKIYGGPKWLICTGYLNINTPSLYD